MKKTYETPTITDYGTVDQITKSPPKPEDVLRGDGFDCSNWS